MTISRTQVPKPENHQDFERLSAILWCEKLRDPHIQRYGRHGTGQDGIDIVGIRGGDPRNRVGIQCKLKTGTAKLTAEEFEADFDSALGIDPPLTEFHIVTTADRDRALQNLASKLQIREYEKGRQIHVGYWAWNAITDELGQYPKALLAFDETFGTFGQLTLGRIEDGIALQQSGQELLLAKLDAIETRMATSDSTVGAASEVERQLDAEINGYRDANNGGRPSLALSQFTKMLERVEAEGVSGRILFRVKANIGACHLRLGDDQAAIKWLLEAYDHAPTEPKAIANKAFAHLLSEDFDTVLAMGRENLATNAADEMLSSHVVQAARFTEFDGDPLTLVPEKDRETEGVLIALALYQRGRGDRTWKTTATTLAERFPQERLARQLRAEAMLDEVIGESGYLDHANLSAEDRSRLHIAAEILSDLWTETLASERKYDEADIALCGNLVLAYRAQADYTSAIDILRQALTIEEIDEEFLVRAAATAMEAGDPIIGEVLPRLPSSQARNLLVVQAAVTKGDFKTLAALDPDAITDYPAVEQPLCRTAIRLGKLFDAPDTEIILPLANIIEEVADDIRSSIVVAQFCSRKGMAQLADKAWANARGRINEETHISGRMMGAMYAYRHRLWSDVADLMFGHVAVDRDSDELRSLAAAIVQERPTKQRAIDFFHCLPEEIKTLPRYRYLRGMMHFNRGDLPTAERIFADDLAEKPNLELLGMSAMVLRRQNRSPEIPELLSRYDVFGLEGSAEEKMAIAHELRRVGRDHDAINLAYPVLRENANDADINVSFAMLVFMMQGFGKLVSVSEVQPGNWVRLTRDDDKEFSFVIREGTDDPTGGFLSPTHQLAALALGKRVGDTLTLPQQFGEPVIWTVADIKHRYLHAFQDILDNFEAKFPDAKGMFSVRMKDGDLSSIIDQVKRMGERGEKAVDLYVKSGFPIQLVAGLFNDNPIKLAGGIAEIHDIKSCLGNAPEQAAARELIARHGRKGVVMDAHAVWTAATLDVLDIVTETLGPIYLPQSGIDALLLFHGFDEIETYPKLSLVHRRGETFREEWDRETVEARNAYVAQQIKKIEAACIVAPVVAPNEIGALEAVCIENCGERVFDPIYLAAGGRILLSEDLTYRQLANQVRRVDGLWLQAVLAYARLNDTFSEERYADAAANLAILRHGPVAVDPLLIRKVVDRDPSQQLRTVEALARYIGNPCADYFSHAAVVRRFIKASAGDKSMDKLIRQRVMSILLRNLIRLARGNWPWVLEAVDQQLADDDRDYLYGWVRGHFLDPHALYRLRENINAYIRNQILIEMRRETGTSPYVAILGGSGQVAPPLPYVASPRVPSQGRPVIPSKKRGRRRRR